MDSASDTRQAVDAARVAFWRELERVHGKEISRTLPLGGLHYCMEGLLAATEAWARADERARLRAAIGASSQDAAELADAGNRELDARDAEAQAEQDALDQADA